MIDEKKLIKDVLNTSKDICSEWETAGILNLIHKQQKVGEWIPVSESLPEKAGKYLVTIKSGLSTHTTVRRFNPKPKHPDQNGPIFTKHLACYSGWERATRGVIAWMPLPTAYEVK